MNLVELERKLTAAGRANPPGDQVPYAFEKRVMARLGSERPQDLLAFWSTALWRAAFSSVAVALLLSGVSFWSEPEEEVSLSQLYDSTLYAATEQMGESW